MIRPLDFRTTWPGGVEVSFGQWQKLALARGFMRERPLLLVLDGLGLRGASSACRA